MPSVPTISSTGGASEGALVADSGVSVGMGATATADADVADADCVAVGGGVTDGVDVDAVVGDGANVSLGCMATTATVAVGSGGAV